MLRDKECVEQRQSFRILVLLILCTFCAGCQITIPATERSSLSSNHTLITTFPRLLPCKIEGYSGNVLKITSPTLVDLRNFEKPVIIVCTHASYWASNLILEPTYKKLLLNRLANGEKLSLLNSRYTADDLGAQSKLPRALHVALRKKAFKNSKTKNAYYAEELLYAQKGWKSLIKELISSCAQQSDQISTSCRTSIQRIERFMRNDLMTIEQQRRRSSIE